MVIVYHVPPWGSKLCESRDQSRHHGCGRIAEIKWLNTWNVQEEGKARCIWDQPSEDSCPSRLLAPHVLQSQVSGWQRGLLGILIWIGVWGWSTRGQGCSAQAVLCLGFSVCLAHREFLSWKKLLKQQQKLPSWRMCTVTSLPPGWSVTVDWSVGATWLGLERSCSLLKSFQGSSEGKGKWDEAQRPKKERKRQRDRDGRRESWLDS